jgi:hypothetical protein
LAEACRQRETGVADVAECHRCGIVSREFVYLYQSVEIDINRQWRKNVAGNRMSFSNFYLTGSWMATDFATVYASFDARRSFRTFNTIDTPDSLFNDTLYRGIDGGPSLTFPRGISVRGSVGVR